MFARKFLSFTLLMAAALANETVTLFLPEFQGMSLVGRVIETNGPLTTYVINCDVRPKNREFYVIGECEGSATGFTVTHGPSTFRAVFDYPEFTMAEECAISASTSLSCLLSMDYGSSTEVESGVTVGPADDFYQALVITGREAATTPATVKASPTGVIATATGSSVKASAASTAGLLDEKAKKESQAWASSSTSTSQSTNAGLAKATGNIKWAIGGGAAAMAVIGLA
ncbi:hypothetical protein BDV23DRAFT_186349 [Aspergillus alliaceus]|uniref:GPI anchored protein n=1 Tax=Petromyces alliaceus TaxID=209559 RepID=A0A5N7C017_PETAA|nr:hypothetical protein BDV23DRAFT_186349 [Aspergillus alliaceus]